MCPLASQVSVWPVLFSPKLRNMKRSCRHAGDGGDRPRTRPPRLPRRYKTTAARFARHRCCKLIRVSIRAGVPAFLANEELLTIELHVHQDCIFTSARCSSSCQSKPSFWRLPTVGVGDLCGFLVSREHQSGNSQPWLSLKLRPAA